MYKTIGLYVLLFALAGCATTTDPRQGGLFSYNPNAYEQRLQQRRQTLEALKRNQADLPALEVEAEAKRRVLAEQKNQLTALEAELDDVKQRLASYHVKNQEQATEKTRLEHDLLLAKTQLQALQKQEDDSPQDMEAKQAEIQRLRADIEKLTKVIDVLIQSSQ
jgi:chromosome segregation ATPase